MAHAGVDDVHSPDSRSPAGVLNGGVFIHPRGWLVADNTEVERPALPRRTPRKSLIVVLPDNYVVSADLVTKRLLSESDHEEVDVIVACAGQPRNLTALQRKVRDLQVLLAPEGTSTEDLRELAMKRAPGDIVTLLTGSPFEREDL